MRLFISYAHVDEYLVREYIVTPLRNASHDPWFDHRLTVGRNWKEQLLEAIKECDVFVYALTPESVSSEWCQWEFAQAVKIGKPIIPILLRKTRLPNPLNEIQYLDFSKGPTFEGGIRLMSGLWHVGTKISQDKAPKAPNNPTDIPAQAIFNKSSKFQINTRLLFVIIGIVVVILIWTLAISLRSLDIVINSTATATNNIMPSETKLITPTAIILSTEISESIETRMSTPAATLTEIPTHIISTITDTPSTVSQAQNSNSRIVFMSDRDGNREIYTMNADGTDIRRLTNDPNQDLQPVWSPDKRQIAFISNREGNFAVYIMGADGGNVRRLSMDTFAYHEYPAWSPDGHYLVYASDKSGNFDIYILNLNSGEETQLTVSDADESDPSWSPDGRQIAYLQIVDGAFEIFLMDNNGANPQRLTQSNGGDYFSPRWSPDGTQLAYVTVRFDRVSNMSEIYIRDTGSGQEQLLISQENSFIGGITWSEDGEKIAYQFKGSQSNSTIIIVDVNNSNTRIITSIEYNSEGPNWFTPKP